MRRLFEWFGAYDPRARLPAPFQSRPTTSPEPRAISTLRKHRQRGGLGRFTHRREQAAIDKQTIVRLNRDTLFIERRLRPRRWSSHDHAARCRHVVLCRPSSHRGSASKSVCSATSAAAIPDFSQFAAPFLGRKCLNIVVSEIPKKSVGFITRTPAMLAPNLIVIQALRNSPAAYNSFAISAQTVCSTAQTELAKVISAAALPRSYPKNDTKFSRWLTPRSPAATSSAPCAVNSASNIRMRRSDNVANIDSALGQLGSRLPLPIHPELFKSNAASKRRKVGNIIALAVKVAVVDSPERDGMCDHRGNVNVN
jgi:hypothetical protein